jgi:hypothetical protein
VASCDRCAGGEELRARPQLVPRSALGVSGEEGDRLVK